MKYKKITMKLTPGFTYEFEWTNGLKFEGVYLRQNAQNPKVMLFKVLFREEESPVYVPVDETLQECVWFNEHSWDDLAHVWETAKPDFVKPEFDKKDNFAAALVFDALPMHGLNCCPKCGKEGKWIRMAIVCPNHGVFGGA